MFAPQRLRQRAVRCFRSGWFRADGRYVPFFVGVDRVPDIAFAEGDRAHAAVALSQKDVVDIMTSFRKTAQTMDEISQELKAHPLKFIMK